MCMRIKFTYMNGFEALYYDHRFTSSGTKSQQSKVGWPAELWQLIINKNSTTDFRRACKAIMERGRCGYTAVTDGSRRKYTGTWVYYISAQLPIVSLCKKKIIIIIISNNDKRYYIMEYITYTVSIILYIILLYVPIIGARDFTLETG